MHTVLEWHGHFWCVVNSVKCCWEDATYYYSKRFASKLRSTWDRSQITDRCNLENPIWERQKIRPTAKLKGPTHTSAPCSHWSRAGLVLPGSVLPSSPETSCPGFPSTHPHLWVSPWCFPWLEDMCGWGAKPLPESVPALSWWLLDLSGTETEWIVRPSHYLQLSKAVFKDGAYLF